MKRILFVLAGLCLVHFSQAQTLTCPGELSIEVPGSGTGDVLEGSGQETNAACNDLNGDPTGAIVLTVSGGTEPYQYTWSNGATTKDISGLGAGQYTVDIVDAQGCEMQLIFDITEPDPIVISGTPTDLLCNSDNTGSGGIALTVTDGTGPYTYAWTGPNGFTSTSEDLTDLVDGGEYTVVVTDANDCTETASFTIAEPEFLTVSAEKEDLGCNSADGSADGEINISVTGGTAPYTYAWTGTGTGLDASAEDQTGLSAGEYTVVVTDANDCTTTITVTLDEPDPMEILAQVTHLTCHPEHAPEDGTITINEISGGTAPYSYAWTGPNGFTSTSQNLTDLEAGTYNLVITDGEDCTFSAEYPVTQPDEIIVADFEIDQPTCNGASGALDGEISLTSVVGGTGTLTYLWDDEAGTTGPVISNVGEGSYTVTIEDENGCTTTATYSLEEPEAVTCSLDSPTPSACGDHNIMCNGGTADITVAATGGTGVYEYSIDGGTTWQSGTVFNMPAGDYTVTVKDANGCTSTCDIVLTEPDALDGATCVEEDECQVGEGQIEVQAIGGCAPYTVTWTATNGATLTQTSLEIPAEGGSVTFEGAEGNETYTFTIVDANGCQIGG